MYDPVPFADHLAHRADATWMPIRMQIARHIVAGGHAVIAPAPGQVPSIAYTIGMAARELPELLVSAAESGDEWFLGRIASLQAQHGKAWTVGELVEIGEGLTAEIAAADDAQRAHAFWSHRYWGSDRVELRRVILPASRAGLIDRFRLPEAGGPACPVWSSALETTAACAQAQTVPTRVTCIPAEACATAERCRAKAARRGLGFLMAERPYRGSWEVNYLTYDEHGIVHGTACVSEMETWLEDRPPLPFLAALAGGAQREI